MFGRTKNEGRKASEIYGTKSADRIIRDQCKESQKGGKKK